MKERIDAGMEVGLNIPPQLKLHLQYPRLSRYVGTVVMIDAEYFLQRECARGFQQNGWRVVVVKLKPVESFIVRLLEAMVLHRPDLLFTLNHLGFDSDGVLTNLLEQIEQPFVSWFVDSPAYILLDHEINASPWTILPVWERSFIPYLKSFGFDHAFHLPLAGHPEFFWNDKERSASKYALSFVGDSMKFGSTKWRQKCRKFPGINRLRTVAVEKILRDRTVDPAAEAAAFAIENGMEFPNWTLREELTFSSSAVLEATRLSRWRMARNLAAYNLELFGDDGWREAVGHKTRVHKPVEYYSELPDVYTHSEINLNLTSMQMQTAVNQRVFDVPLAGGFLLTDFQEDIETLFDTRKDVVTFEDQLELPGLVKYYNNKESERRRITEAAAERIVSEHTYRHRINRIIAYARRNFAFKPVHAAMSTV